MDREELQAFAELLPEEYQERLEARKTATYEVGPIDPDPEALSDASRRTVVRREKGKRFPFPVPNGWFVVAESRELAPGEVKSLYAFGRDLVLFRTETGEPRMIDAYCPHLGAHIGTGGRVDGDGIRCPFHGWRYDGASGRCTDIPYAKDARIPPGARVRTYPMVERNQMIWAWHHLEGGRPFYEVPVVPEFDDPAWLPYEVKTFEIATCIQEMAENDADFAHFRYVHGSAEIPEGEVVIDGPYKRNSTEAFVRESFGLGCTVLRIADVFRFLSSVVPLDEENVRLVWWFTAPRASGEGAAKVIAEAFFTGVSQDLAIWENKRYEPRPLLTESEQGIAAQRRWALQFYSGYEP
jgi:phenylpropionate dioxygenase-like ring-hydroxylating dioxygenase large terminal subunit